MCRRGNGPTPRARLRGPRAPRRGAPSARPTSLHPDGSGDPARGAGRAAAGVGGGRPGAGRCVGGRGEDEGVRPRGGRCGIDPVGENRGHLGHERG
ncbi:hypothetical protein R6Z07F_014054 [Ovis aries]